MIFKKIIENDIADDLYKINDESRECRHCFFFKLSNSCQARSCDPEFNSSSHSNFKIKMFKGIKYQN